MTFGIDVAGYQAGIDYARAKREGVQFVIVKAAGQQTGSPYTANGYHEHIDRARAAGIAGIGHYFIPGQDDPGVAFDDVEAQADQFVRALHGFDRDHDVLALDNEPLDGDATYWRQDDVMRFFNRVRALTGIPWSRLWLYCPASLTRANGPWNRVTDAGIRIWWSAYGDFPTGHAPDHTPSLQGKIARWDVHQFSSRVAVAGMSVDGNYSPHSVATLFGGRASEPAPSKPSAPSTSGRDWSYWEPTGALAKRVQRALKARGRYSGPVDGVFGPNTRKGVQETLRHSGEFVGTIDGVIGRGGSYGIQTYARRFGDYAGPIDGAPRTASWTGFALGLERP